MAFAVASFVVILGLNLAPRDARGGVAVIFPPGTGLEQSIIKATEAGAALARTTLLPFMVVVMPERADYAIRVRSSGALALLDPGTLGTCLSGGIK